LLNLKLKH